MLKEDYCLIFVRTKRSSLLLLTVKRELSLQRSMLHNSKWCILPMYVDFLKYLQLTLGVWKTNSIILPWKKIRLVLKYLLRQNTLAYLARALVGTRKSFIRLVANLLKVTNWLFFYQANDIKLFWCKFIHFFWSKLV